MTEDLTTLADRLEAAIVREGLKYIRRIGVVRETASTQDFARMLSHGEPGLAVFAGRQTSGRGRLGRPWADTSHLGVAMTFVLPSESFSAERLSIGTGLAACRVVEAATSARAVGLRWPNDVVTRSPNGPGPKVAGVLIEQAGPLSFVGIGINVMQERADWPADLAPRVASVKELGSSWERGDIAERLMIELDQALLMTPAVQVEEWSKRELLLGRAAAFLHDGREHHGIVETIDPHNHIHLRTSEGVVRLPALTTSMVHDLAL